MLKKIKEWWKGPLIDFSGDGIVMMPYHKRPFLRRMLVWLRKHWLEHWKFWIPTVITLLGMIIAYIELKK